MPQLAAGWRTFRGGMPAGCRRIVPMEKPLIAQKSPYETAVEAGKSYWWCACGRSKSQPFCDGSHKGTGLSPVEYKAKRSRTVYFCGCKQTATPTICDGSHDSLN
jgi:CDGSH-type Zn-finger protein